MHPPSGPAWLVWLETSGVAVAMRQWTWLYPAVEMAHIVGFVALVGAALMFDARLLGRSRPRRAVHGALRRCHRLRPPRRLLLTSPRRGAAVPGSKTGKNISRLPGPPVRWCSAVSGCDEGDRLPTAARAVARDRVGDR